MSPVSRLSLRDNSRSSGRSPIQVGTSPVSLLLASERSVMLVRPASCRGIVPVRLLPDRSRYPRLDRFPNTAGIRPDISLSFRCKLQSLSSSAISTGICAVRLLYESDRPSSRSRLPSSDGIGPDSSLSLRVNEVSWSSCPISGIKVPLRLLYHSSSSVTLPSASTSTPYHAARGWSESQLSLSCHSSPFVALYSLTSTAASSGSDRLAPQ